MFLFKCFFIFPHQDGMVGVGWLGGWVGVAFFFVTNQLVERWRAREICLSKSGGDPCSEVSGMESSLLEVVVVKWKMEDVCWLVQDGSCGATIPQWW